MFFGTPHQGGNGVALGKLVLRVASVALNTNDRAMKHLEQHSEWLETQLGQYSAISQDFDTTFLYESYPTPLPLGSSIIVPKASATVLGTENTESIEVRKNHHTMVKFEVATDADFQVVSSRLVIMNERAECRVRENWAKWTKTQEKRIAEVSPHDFTLPLQLPRSRNHNFTGRNIILKQIHDRLTEVGGESGEILALHGTGGLGKTQIAVEYAYLNALQYSSIIWIDAQSQSTTTASVISFVQRLLDHYANSSERPTPDYPQIAQSLGLRGLVDRNGFLDPEGRPPRVIDAAKRWLEQQGNNKWLMICDNVDDLESFDISEFFPVSAHRKVLITSRRPECVRFGGGLALDRMGQEESLDLFTRSLGKHLDILEAEEVEEARTIIDRLGYLPLAIDQAAAYLQMTSKPLKNYLSVFEHNFELVMRKKPPKALWLYREDTVFTTWEVSYSAVQSLCPEAAEILVISSFFSNQDVPEDLFKHCAQPSTSTDFVVSDAVATLLSYSLVERARGGTSFSVHPLIHLWARERLVTSQRQEYVLRAIRIMGSALEEDGSFSNESYAFRRKVSPHLQMLNMQVKGSLFEIPINLSIRDAEHFYSIGSELLGYERLDDAFQWLSRALSSCTENDGTSHATTLMIVSKLGRLHEIQQDFALALKHYERAYTGRREIYGEEHELTLRSLSGIGRVYGQMNEVEKSLETLQQVLLVRKRVLGDLHRETLGSYYILGAHFASNQQTDKALEMLKLALTGQEKVQGEDHPVTLEAVCLIGGVYLARKDYGESMKYYQRALAGQEHQFGTDHAKWLYTAFRIGMVHQACSEYDAALKWYSRVLARREVLAGKDHPSVLEVVQKMAEVQYASGHYSAAVELCSRLLATRKVTPEENNTGSLKAVGQINNV
ncbi:hypothetical protein MMC27_003156 [Xylographa pallens]|nr:hypothetical protein [Xylographa pallens]